MSSPQKQSIARQQQKIGRTFPGAYRARMGCADVAGWTPQSDIDRLFAVSTGPSGRLAYSNLSATSGGLWSALSLWRGTPDCKTWSGSAHRRLLFIYTLATELFVPWAIRTAVVQQELLYRVPGKIPFFRWSDALLPLAFILSALIIDGIAWMRQRQGKASSWTDPWHVVAWPACCDTRNSDCAHHHQLEPEYRAIFSGRTGQRYSTRYETFCRILAVPVVLVIGVFGAIWGADFGDIWRLNSR